MSFFNDVAAVWVKYNAQILGGVGNTMLIAIVGTLIGLLIGLLNGIIRTIPQVKNKLGAALMKVVNFLITAYVEVFRGTPMMVQAMIIFRGGIISIDKGQFEGAASIGMSHFQTMIYVVIPQALRNILPSVSNEFVVNIKDTSVLNVIGVSELFYYTAMAAKNSYKIFASYVIACVIYFILTFTVTRLLRLFEKLLAGKDNYTIYGSQSSSSAEIHLTEQEAGGDGR